MTLKPPDGLTLPTNSRVDVLFEAPINVEYPEYGADSSLADNSTALQAAIDALPAEGGEIYCPGRYDFATTLDVESRRGVVLRGQGGMRVSNQAPASRLRYKGTGAGAAINARLSSGFAMRNLGVHHESSAFTGTLVDLAGTDANNYSIFTRFEDVWFMGWDALSAGTATGVDLKLIVDASFRDCQFEALTYGVKGSVADPASSYSNVVLFDHCYWSRMVTASVLNPGQQWTFQNCTFQQLRSGASVAVISNFRTQSLAFIGCGFWDATAGGKWLLLRGEGTIVTGCLFGGVVASEGIDAQNVQNFGLVIAGNRFQGASAGTPMGYAVDLGSGRPDTHVFANSFADVTNKVYSTDQPYAVTSGVYHRGASGESNPYSYPVSSYARAFDGALKFTAITAAQAPNDSVFLDSADNVLKTKNNSGTVAAI